MAISGSGGWIPSNRVRLINGRLVFLEITQNKPSTVLVRDPEEVARRLLAGEAVMIDIRYSFQEQVFEHLKEKTE